MQNMVVVQEEEKAPKKDSKGGANLGKKEDALQSRVSKEK